MRNSLSLWNRQNSLADIFSFQRDLDRLFDFPRASSLNHSDLGRDYCRDRSALF